MFPAQPIDCISVTYGISSADAFRPRRYPSPNDRMQFLHSKLGRTQHFARQTFPRHALMARDNFQPPDIHPYSPRNNFHLRLLCHRKKIARK